ncbi:MAG: DUF1302 family protein [bacterium]
MFKRHWLWLAIIAVMLPQNTARAGDGGDDDDDDTGIKFALSGFIRSDIRVALPKMNPFWKDVNELKQGFSRNENTLRTRFTVRSGDYKGVAELDFVYTGYVREMDDLGLLGDRSNLDPFRVEAHALYFDITDLFTKGFDVRIGKQIVTWGKADQFNPTSNINSLDLEDALLFGDRVSNNMLRIDYNPKKDWILSFIWVPIFKPNQIPDTAAIAIKGVDRMPMATAALRRRLHVERDYFEQFFGRPTVVTQAKPIMPENTFENSQIGFKVAGKVAKMDLSLSYYYGRSGHPQPFVERTFNNPTMVDAQVGLMYPKMHVIGFDWAGQIPLGKTSGGGRGIGFWIEAALFFPQKVVMPIYANDMPLIGSGEYDYNGEEPGIGKPPVIVDSKPFAKWVVGIDYTFNKHLFINIQWVHGFVDEFGAGDFFHASFIPTKGYTDLDVNNDGVDDLDLSGFGQHSCMNLGANVGNGDICAKEYKRPRLGDYLVAGADIKFYKSQMLLRFFIILDMTGVFVSEWVANDPSNPFDGRRVTTHKHAFTADGFSMVIFPSYIWSVGSGVELSAGAFWLVGKRHTKFGDPATGGSVVFLKGKFSF